MSQHFALTYDSIAANPEPIIVVENTHRRHGAQPGQRPVDVQRRHAAHDLLLQHQRVQPGRRAADRPPGDQCDVAGHRPLHATRPRSSTSAATNATITYSGSTNLLNYSGNAFGAGWTLEGLEQITSESGGVILDLGDEGRTLWFASSGSGGGTYTDPAGEFSTLVEELGREATPDTLTDGDQITFNSGGYETATIDLNNQHITFAYNGVEPDFDDHRQLWEHHDVFLQRRLSPDDQGPGQPHRHLHAQRRQPDRRHAAGRQHLGLFLRLGRPVDPDHRSTFQHSHHRVRLSRPGGDDLAARQHDGEIHQRPGIGLDQQRHVGAAPRRPRCWPSRAARTPAPTATRRRSSPTGWAWAWPATSSTRWATSSFTTGIPTAWPRWPWIRSIGTRSFSYDSKGNITSVLYEDGNYESTRTTAIPSR